MGLRLTPGFVKPGFHMIVTVGDASPRQARVHIRDGCVKWKHFLNDVADVADQTGTVRERIERVEMSLKPGFYMIVTEIVSICRRLIGDTSPMCRSRSPTVTIIWKPGLGPVYTIPFSFHIGLGKAIRCENFSCLHDAVFIS